MTRLVKSTRFAFAMLVGLATTITFAEDIAPASTRFAKRNTQSVPDFQKHIVPLLGRLGCNSGQCHGSFQGRGDLRLSLFGFDFKKDHAALTGEASSIDGPRITLKQAGKSLVVRKPALIEEHEGGRRFLPNSWEHHLFLRWIETGAAGTTTPKELVRIEVQPKEIVAKRKGDMRNLKVTAVWKDGTREDVTCLCRFRSNDDVIAKVDRNGRVTATGSGDTHVVVFYDNGVAAVPVMLPMAGPTPRHVAKPLTHPIDKHIAEKLAKLRIHPSALCTDTEFLRRVSIDMTGTLPTPTEVKAFLSDTSKDKRKRKVDEILKRPAYAAWWANKLCDFTGCSPTAITQVTEVGQATAVQWYQWIYRRVLNNTSYDKLVEGIVLSRGRASGQSFQDYSAEMSSYVRRKSPADFSQRATMPHYWTRDSVREPKDKALAFAHSFLGIQLQCAECHKHPFDQWTQQDFNDFTRFFESVRKAGGTVSFPAFAAARKGGVITWPELRLIDRDTKTTWKLLRSRSVTLLPKEDPRRPIMKWLRDKQNPWFARAFVNRVWAGYFHVGIVDPPDSLTPANPPSNPALLNWLTTEFIKSGYNMKWLHRQIATSHAYQRSWKPNATNRADRRNFSRAIPRRIPAEVVYDAVKQVVAADADLDSVRENLARRAGGHLSMRMAGTYAMRVFGKPDRAVNCDCERVNAPTLLQSVFLQNDPLIRMRLSESDWLGEIEKAEKAKQQPDTEQAIRAAWLRALSRLPTKKEVTRAKRHLAGTKTLREGLSDLLWALLNTKEFLLNK